jgi:hypothetical protein
MRVLLLGVGCRCRRIWRRSWRGLLGFLGGGVVLVGDRGEMLTVTVELRMPDSADPSDWWWEAAYRAWAAARDAALEAAFAPPPPVYEAGDVVRHTNGTRAVLLKSYATLWDVVRLDGPYKGSYGAWSERDFVKVTDA